MRDVTLEYTDHYGNQETALIRPQGVDFDLMSGQLESEWVLHAWDYVREEWRDFAVQGIRRWTPHIPQCAHDWQTFGPSAVIPESITACMLCGLLKRD